MSGAVFAVFVAEFVDDGAGHGGAQEGGYPGFFFDFKAQGVDFSIHSCPLLFLRCVLDNFDPATECFFAVGDVAAFEAGYGDDFGDNGVLIVGFSGDVTSVVCLFENLKRIDEPDGREGNWQRHSTSRWSSRLEVAYVARDVDIGLDQTRSARVANASISK